VWHVQTVRALLAVMKEHQGRCWSTDTHLLSAARRHRTAGSSLPVTMIDTRVTVINDVLLLLVNAHPCIDHIIHTTT